MTATNKLSSPGRSAVVIAGHGSRDPDALREFEALVELVRERAGQRIVRHGYLEFAAPTIADAAAACVAEGATEVAVVPGVLLGARHAKNDMPAELLALARAYPQVDFHFGAPMDLHPLLLQLAQQRVVEAEAQSEEIIHRQDACLVLVGRGTTDPDANGEVAKLARMLQEGMGFGGVKVCFSGTATPLVREGLSQAAGQGWQRLVVLPFFLFDGVLVKRIYAAADELVQREPGVEVLKASYLGVHAHVADVMLERAAEAVEGRAAMNCSLCKYRVQIVGFEQQVGEPQRAHHLQVRDLSAREQAVPVALQTTPYVPHPIEAESMRIIDAGRDWRVFPPEHLTVLQRLVHTSGDFAAADELYFSAGAVQAGMKAILRCKRVVTDVTMVQTGLKRAVLEQLGVQTWCGVHDPETHLMAQNLGMTRSAAGIRRAWQKFGNDMVLAIGDAPTAITEAVRLIREHGWRPQLVIGLPVGFVGTRESKDELRRCLQVPRITNSGTRGGSPWAATVVNALMIDAIAWLVEQERQAEGAG
ncbi:precorrin-8X methylmutase [Herbaspirillum sp. NPDC087042]|uniref:precorrin-8X methylmutase n=1 Tax=Herbaspirillum sp. NPDC087042 TaxID=3364004 RepID=UPI0038216694